MTHRAIPNTLTGGFLILALPVVAFAAEPARARFAFVEPHMGTQFRIVLYAPDEAAAKRAAQAAFARAEDLNDILSDYKSTSELMRLCAKAGGAPVKVGDDLFTVLKQAQEFAEKSDGAFDVTLGPLTHLWRKTRRTQILPSDGELADAKRRSGHKKMTLDEKARTVQLAVAGMQLDLGGIAKGFAADEMQKVLRRHGVTRALVACGGDIVVSDPPPDAAGWKVGIAPLDDPARPPSRFLMLRNAAVSTSGDSEQHVEINGVRYSHIIDPKTGLGLLGRNSVTVVAPDGTTSDGMTKVVMLMDRNRALALVEQTDGVSALIIHKTDAGDQVVKSKRWKEAD